MPWAYTPVCYTRTFSGRSSTKIETLHYDIFPATFADFVALATKPDTGLGLSWDSRFPSIADADGDGLLSSAHNGIDPNDNPSPIAHGWDTDNDGLSDGNVRQPDVRGGKLTAGAGMTIIIDGDLPTSTAGGLSSGQYILGNTIHTIGGNADVATVTITVHKANQPPAALPDSYSVDEDTPLTMAAPGVPAVSRLPRRSLS